MTPGSKGEEHGIAAALLTALPFGTAASSMLLCAKHSQATGADLLSFVDCEFA